ncbi:MAG: DUF3800 domain-containing protein [Thainema sp.]
MTKGESKALDSVQLDIPVENSVQLAKEHKIEREREILLNKLAESNLNGLREKVAFILNHYPDARNSDNALAWRFWKVFEPEHAGSGLIDEKRMQKLTKLTSLTRARAKIQNEYKLFLADTEVRKHRRNREEDERNKQVADKPPDIPEISFYIDESSKNGQYVVVGGLCSPGDVQSYKLLVNLTQWKKKKGLSYEFHFSKLSKNRLEEYKEFFTVALSHFDTFSFKAVALEQAGTRKSINEIIRELHYHLVHIGIKHEVQTKRLTLPRHVNIYKDQEDGTDKLEMARLEQDLQLAFNNHFENEATLKQLIAVESEENFYIQLSDLFIGSVARILNRDRNSTSFNHKDVLADYIVSLLGLNLSGSSTYKDSAFVHFL